MYNCMKFAFCAVFHQCTCYRARGKKWIFLQISVLELIIELCLVKAKAGDGEIPCSKKGMEEKPRQCEEVSLSSLTKCIYLVKIKSVLRWYSSSNNDWLQWKHFITYLMVESHELKGPFCTLHSSKPWDCQQASIYHERLATLSPIYDGYVVQQLFDMFPFLGVNL